jgi:hypothetical protein
MTHLRLQIYVCLHWLNKAHTRYCNNEKSYKMCFVLLTMPNDERVAWLGFRSNDNNYRSRGLQNSPFGANRAPYTETDTVNPCATATFSTLFMSSCWNARSAVEHHHVVPNGLTYIRQPSDSSYSQLREISRVRLPVTRMYNGFHIECYW